MVMIKEETDVRDRPIYIQLGDRGDLNNSFWYVIEEKEVEEILGKKKDDDDDRNNNSYPETDKIRELWLPSIDVLSDSIVVSRSRIFTLGGYLIKNEDSDGDHCDYRGRISKNVFYFEANNTWKGWLKGPTLNLSRNTLSVAALEKSSLIVACGNMRDDSQPLSEFLHDSLKGTWWTSPPILGEECFEVNFTRVVAVTDTKVYLCDMGDRHRKGTGLSFDVQNSEWDIFHLNFDSIWRPSGPGVVLDFCSNSYLFIFAKNRAAPASAEEFCVYNLKTCTWLPLPVKGLPRDGKFLPKDEDLEISSRKYLLRMNQKNKLALVWSMLPFANVDDHKFRTKIQCTKFIITYTFDRRSQHPIFHANIVSFGCFDVKGGIKMWNCAA